MVDLNACVWCVCETGIIIDTFGEMRESMREKKEDMTTRYEQRQRQRQSCVGFT